MNSKNKNVIIGGLLAIVFIMAVGYAAFSTSLNINGTASITSNWDVEITDIVAGTPVGTASSTSAKVADGGLSASFGTTLKSPGDSITYTVTVQNKGDLNAKLSGIVFTPGTGVDTAAIDYSYAGIAVNDTLNAGASTSFTVTVTYDSSVTSQPAEALLNNDLTMTLTYVQA